MVHTLRLLVLPLAAAIAMTSCASLSPFSSSASVLRGKTIVIDPGHGGTAKTDHFRVGPTGEREEWINLRVGLILKDLLQAKGAHVLMTRTEDVNVPLKDRAMLAVDNHADVFISIHHNATADRSVNFPIVYYHANASGNKAGVKLAECVGRRIAEALYDGPTPISIVSDHTIFPGTGAAVIRHSYGIPGVIGEASFFSNPEEEQRLKDPAYNRKEAVAYVKALEDFFASPPPPIKDQYNGGHIPPMKTLQEGERMQNAALQWREDFMKGEALLEQAEAESKKEEKTAKEKKDEAAQEQNTGTSTAELREQALIHFTRSAQSFPDSPVARACHLHMADILKAQGKTDEAALERRRVEEYYVPMKVPD